MFCYQWYLAGARGEIKSLSLFLVSYIIFHFFLAYARKVTVVTKRLILCRRFISAAFLAVACFLIAAVSAALVVTSCFSSSSNRVPSPAVRSQRGYGAAFLISPRQPAQPLEPLHQLDLLAAILAPASPGSDAPRRATRFHLLGTVGWRWRPNVAARLPPLRRS